MICPHCSTANRSIARFCKRCGIFLGQTCPNCGNELPEAPHFCDICGHRLASAPWPGDRQPSDAPRLRTSDLASSSSDLRPRTSALRPPSPELTPYLPTDLHTKLQAGQRSGAAGGVDSSLGERRIVTILFCDVKGSTAAARQLDPEEWSEIINGAFEHMIRPVYKYEGTVARLMGDGVLAFFGAPMAHEDDPQRAVRAGLEIQEGITAYGVKIRQDWGLEIAARVGINTGLVVVGEVGSDLRLEYTALGDAINLAARMEQTATPGTVQIAEATYRLVAPSFDIEPLGGVEVKGRDEPVPAYRVLRWRATTTRGSQTRVSPLVGRERELSILEENLTSVQAGAGRIVCLIGDAGIGKTRLAEALSERGAAAMPMRWITCQSVSYEADRPYGQFQQFTRQMAGIHTADPSEIVREKLAHLSEQAGQPDMALELLTSLAGEMSATELPLEGQALQQTLFTVITQALTTWAADAPAVLLFDDLQWADSASVDLLKHLLVLADRKPLLFLCLFRPERQAPAWALRTTAENDYPHRYTEIQLGPLSDPASRQLAEHLLAAAGLSLDLAAPILAKAEGNPLFVEEVVRSLAERRTQLPGTGSEAGNTRIPDSLQALLTARLDQLDEAARSILQLAAVIGRRFFYRVLRQIVAGSLDLDRELSLLQREDLIREAARIPELEYLFRHALIQEATYRTILRKQRREYHRRVGEAIEQVFGDRLDDFATQLARHFDEAGDPRAASYHRRAGDMAFRLYATAEAITHYRRVLELAHEHPADDPAVLTHAYSRLGRAFELDSRYAEAQRTYENMEQDAQTRSDARMELAAVTAQIKLRSTVTPLFDLVMARELSQRALQLAATLDDRRVQVELLWNLMNQERFDVGRLPEAIAVGEQALAQARAADAPELLAYVLNDLGDVYGSAGRLRDALDMFEQAQAAWRQLGNDAMLADGLIGAGLWEITAGAYEPALKRIDEALSICQRIGNLWGQAYGQGVRGLALRDLGDFDAALENAIIAVERAEQAGFLAGQVLPRMIIALTYLDLAAPEKAMEAVRAGKAIADARFRQFSMPMLGIIAIVAAQTERDSGLLGELAATVDESIGDNIFAVYFLGLAQIALAAKFGQHERVIELSTRLTTTVQEMGAHSWLPEISLTQSRALRALGRDQEARARLADAIALAERIQQRRTLWLLQWELADLEAAADHTDEAERLRAAARTTLTYLVDHITEPTLRASFLARPEVRALL